MNFVYELLQMKDKEIEKLSNKLMILPTVKEVHDSHVIEKIKPQDIVLPNIESVRKLYKQKSSALDLPYAISENPSKSNLSHNFSKESVNPESNNKSKSAIVSN